MLRNAYFGKNSARDHFNGFVFREFQTNGTPHYHILIANHGVFKRRGNLNKDFAAMIRGKCRRLKIPMFIGGEWVYAGKSTINPESGVDIQEYYDGNLEGYLIKTYRKTEILTSSLA